MKNKISLIEMKNNEGILQVPKHLIGQFSKILKDQFGFQIEENQEGKSKSRDQVFKKQINLILQRIMCRFKKYCEMHEFNVIKQELENIQQKKQFSKKFSLYDLHSLLYENQNHQEFRDRFEDYLSSGQAEGDLNDCKNLSEDLKKDLKNIISKLLLEVIKNNKNTSIFKHLFSREQINN